MDLYKKKHNIDNKQNRRVRERYNPKENNKRRNIYLQKMIEQNINENDPLDLKSAGENIAGNPNITNAVTSWLDSTTHRKNILNSSFNNIGVGITKSPVYGNVIVVLFTLN